MASAIISKAKKILNAAIVRPQFKFYDSGWFEITTATAYVKTHNLGTTCLLVTMIFSESPDYSDPMIVNWFSEDSNEYGTIMKLITTTQFTLQTGVNSVMQSIHYTGHWVAFTGGYLRVFALAL